MHNRDVMLLCFDFYPRSPCGERPVVDVRRATGTADFYPRSPCGERHERARARQLLDNFYPRSPCGERLHTIAPCFHLVYISIHALLAESDASACGSAIGSIISIHALLAESDRRGAVPVILII